MRNERLRDFKKFLYVMWQRHGLPKPTPIQYEIADWLQYGPRRSIIEAFRGVGKSWISQAFVCWWLYWNPQDKVLILSASGARAANFTTGVRRMMMDFPELQWMKPTKEQERNSRLMFDIGPATVVDTPSVRAQGIMSALSGGRAHLIIPDDVEVPNTAETETQREKLEERFTEIDAILVPGGHVRGLGTPQTEESLYPKLSKKGYVPRVWPARVPPKLDQSPYIHEVVTVHGDGTKTSETIDCLAPSIQARTDYGAPTDPDRFTEAELVERELAYGRSGFALQFMLDTSLSDAERYPLKLSDLIVCPLEKDVGPERIFWGKDKEWKPIDGVKNVGFRGDRFYHPKGYDGSTIPYQGSFMAIDPSGRGKDQTAYVITKFLNGHIYVLDFGGFSGDGYSESVLTSLARMASIYDVSEVGYESNYGGGMFGQLFRPILFKYHHCAFDVEGIPVTGQKERRIVETLEPAFNQHRVVFDVNAIDRYNRKDRETVYDLFYQMTRLTKERGALKHDDMIDALSMAVSHWTSKVHIDADEALKRREDRLLEERLRSHDRHQVRNGTEKRLGRGRPIPSMNTRNTY